MPLTAAEIRIVDELKFDHPAAEFIRAQSRNAIERLGRETLEGTEPAPGLSIAVSDGNEAESLMKAITPFVEKHGYRAFWSMRHDSRGLKETDEVAILKTDDPYAMIRLRESNGANCDVSMDDILDRLSAWEEICEFNVVGADHDWVAIQFSRLPQKICAFAEEVYVFCPDAVDQGVGLRRESEHREQFKDARLLCPEISIKPRSAEEVLKLMHSLPPEQAEDFKRLLSLTQSHSTPTDMGIRLLALEISRTNYLFLWWD